MEKSASKAGTSTDAASTGIFLDEKCAESKATRSVQERLKGKITVKARAWLAWHVSDPWTIWTAACKVCNTSKQYTNLRHVTPGQAAQAQPAKEAASGVSALAGKTFVLTEASEKVDTLIHQRPRLRHTTHQTYNPIITKNIQRRFN